MESSRGHQQPYVFLSYSSGDREHALHIADALEKRGFSVWIDRRSIVGGTSWSAEIVQGVEGCTVVLLLCSAQSMVSRNVRQEVQLAWEMERPILPLMLEPVPIAESIRYAIAGRQWIEIFGHDDDTWTQTLLLALSRLDLRPGSPVAIPPSNPDASIEERCPKCSSVVPAAASSCPRCGAPSSVNGSRRGSVASVRERRNLSVVALELVLTDAPDPKPDPEDLAASVDAIGRLFTDILRGYGATPLRGPGHSMLAYFGYPVTREDDARRATRAALALLDNVNKSPSPYFQHYMAVHSGVTIVRQGSPDDSPEVGGDVVAVVSSMLSLCAPGDLVVSDASHRLIQGFFEVEDLGDQRVRGRTQPIRLFRVVGESDARNRIDVAMKLGLSPLVGRQTELAMLQESWQRAREGEGMAVLLVGEPGIGKSRLSLDLRETVARDPDVWMVLLQCSELHQQSPFYPVVDLLERDVLQVSTGKSLEERRSAIRSFLESYGLGEVGNQFLLEALIGMPQDQSVPPVLMAPDRQRQATLELLVELWLSRAQRQPVLVVCEDLHWADPSTLELLSLLVDYTPGVRAMIVMTSRPGPIMSWGNRPTITTVHLGRLSASQTGDLIDELIDSHTIPDNIRQQLVAKSDGVPLFVEELTRSVLESDVLRDGASDGSPRGSEPTVGIPATLADLLLARLEQLGDAREAAQLAAILGREFSFALLNEVAPWGEAWLRQSLRRLLEADLIQHRGLPSKETYIFRHALIRDAAYQSLVRDQRQAYHLRVAAMLVERSETSFDVKPEVLAHHFTEGGDIANAVRYWLLAGQQAMHGFANVEAIAHFERGLGLLARLPEGTERMQVELDMQLSRGVTLMTTRGFAAPEVGAAFGRAREISEGIGDELLLVPALGGLTTYHLVRSELDTALRTAEQQVRLSAELGEEGPQLQARELRGVIHHFLGNYGVARSELEHVIQVYDPERYASNPFIYGHEPASAALSYLSMDLCILGYPDQALQRSREGIELASRFNYPLSTARNLCEAALVRHLRHEPEEAQAQAERGLAFSTEHGIILWIALSTAFLGWAKAASGDPPAGVSLLRRGIEAYRSTGAGLGVPAMLTYLAEALEFNSQVGEAMKVLNEAIDLSLATSEHYFLAESQRLKGALSLRRGETGAGETLLLTALQTARMQGARWFELRIANDLAPLWQDTGRVPEAGALLTAATTGISEGLDTADMKTARRLLESLTPA